MCCTPRSDAVASRRHAAPGGARAGSSPRSRVPFSIEGRPRHPHASCASGAEAGRHATVEDESAT
ncbi:hypothetical protein ACFFRL_10055 [Agromyces hippuratus]|uniref:hypothetical protein n=1 Tax=Agromyces hippuratus TaxID=286438 RepID=UPI0035F00ADD